MPSLLEHITTDLTAAMKARDAATTSALRMLKASITNVEIDARGSGRVVDDGMVLASVKSHAKKLAEAIEEYRKGGRADLATAAEAELRIIDRYLPATMPEGEVRVAVMAMKERMGATQIGPLMGAVMRDLAGKADGTVVRRVVEEVLR